MYVILNRNVDITVNTNHFQSQPLDVKRFTIQPPKTIPQPKYHNIACAMDATEGFTPEKLPDIWAVDNEYLLKELARIRELALRVPSNTVAPIDLHAPINSVIDALWRLESDLRFALLTQRDMQRSFAARAQNLETETKRKEPEQRQLKIHRKKT